MKRISVNANTCINTLVYCPSQAERPFLFICEQEIRIFRYHLSSPEPAMNSPLFNYNSCVYFRQCSTPGNFTSNEDYILCQSDNSASQSRLGRAGPGAMLTRPAVEVDLVQVRNRLSRNHDL
ncbi:hypothetical protein RRG08_012983 [Elysia crispata]|uniref:Uncharacterized protein n=1 Tax=Elysia crispata TaxID=231223 RepID=A0AAE1DPV4_9GAST|nr:hypothetical protein RRG08_012983 [Elysia crispata]